MTINHPRLEFINPASLKPNPNNARTHSDKQIIQIATSIEQFGWLVPIVIDTDNMIAAGHGRWRAAMKKKLREVPVIRAHFLTDGDRRAFALAENRLADLSGWNDTLLAEELNSLFEDGYELEITGFTTADLDFSLPETKVEDGPEEIELPDESGPAVSRIGDLWEIGPHRLYCGDSRDVTSWERLLGEDRAALVFCDAPYNVPIDGFVSGNGRNRHREFIVGAGELSPPEFIAFLRVIFRNCVRFSTNGSIHYQCMDWRHMREMMDAADGVYDQFKQLVVWNKGVGGLGAFYRSQHELVFVFKAGKAKHINNFGLGDTGRYRTNVVDHAGANTFRKGRAADLAAHSTVKPTAMVADFILDCSHRGDLVVDPCLGSGTSLIAAHRTGRRGAGIELDPGYVDTALKRLELASGLPPVLHGDGRTFDQVAADRDTKGN
ncbi:site-specific DNA-methyltransferase [Parasphingopyxis lamellibrachiae]|uniref:Methyltransferase n=1 Tax=Parasphingopyxis lamellibrachiae TaxID=680125 RepID=A0A3D9FGJ4_9SPHN|nr:DNA methyltransferase [Parasphingopyxis lamellibrachiae]RED16657.1 DNA modification methylase [Parasphingopyxis lamellibrachiae]